MPYKNVLAGQEATADDANDLFMQQVVARFTNAAARATAITAPELNQVTMLDTTPGRLQFWNGSAWVNAWADPPVIPPAPFVPYLQSGSSVSTTDVFGTTGVFYPVAFAATPITVAVDGDSGAAGGFWMAVVQPGNVPTAVHFNCKTAAGAIANGTVRINWIAIGARP